MAIDTVLPSNCVGGEGQEFLLPMGSKMWLLLHTLVAGKSHTLVARKPSMGGNDQLSTTVAMGVVGIDDCHEGRVVPTIKPSVHATRLPITLPRYESLHPCCYWKLTSQTQREREHERKTIESLYFSQHCRKTIS